ncbi:hypothetical protein PILCRDRAFT_99343 [Piloderma croceum F 1598]|uniref:Fe2OG dioxygenase domain-containing protein n=1 Tax=Piloderma croceum (strain F 1598) TaxID=765440 RepID=A0A0C3B7A0_PILCF|nr:hypothetical protein PILCRDRAFT_99343 [Piloderma croceum F 1598]
MGGATVNAAADKIFRLYQEQALNGGLLLRRYPLQKNPHLLTFYSVRGILLSNYFSHNGNTVPLLEAPSAVQHAMDLIRLRSLKALGRTPEFNEVLSAAYLNNQKMSFHTDDEMGLGPTIASLSLGSDAVMRFRLRRCKKGPGADKVLLHLKLTLRHGDVLVMDGAHVQKNYVHAVEPVDLRIAATARFISPGES